MEDRHLRKVDNSLLEEYLNIIELSGISKRVLYEIRRFLKHYIEYMKYNIEKGKSIRYFKYLKENCSVSFYRKQMYQILKLLRFLKVDWTDEIKLPPEPNYYPKLISKDDIFNTLKSVENTDYYLRIKALIHLGITSGLRAEELYQLNPDDFDLEKNLVYVNHNPTNGQSTKTKQSRVSFYSDETKQILSEYLIYFNDNSNLRKLFSQVRMERIFRNTPIRVKHLRKFFSQEWDRRGGPTSIKKILMGHSLNGDVDLMHYNAQSEEDLKKIYDRVMN